MNAFNLIAGGPSLREVLPDYSRRRLTSRGCIAATVDGQSLVVTTVSVREGSLEAVAMSRTTSLPKGWRKAVVLKVGHAVHRATGIPTTWIVIGRQERSRSSASNVLFARVAEEEREDGVVVEVEICGELFSSALDVASVGSLLESVQVAVLSGPVFMLSSDAASELILDFDVCEHLSKVLDKAMILPIGDGLATNSTLYFISKSEEETKPFKLCRFDWQTEEISTVGSVIPFGQSSEQESAVDASLEDSVRAAVCDAVEDVIVVLWNSGNLSWFSMSSGARLRPDVALPQDCGTPQCLRFGLNHLRAVVTCEQKTTSTASGVASYEAYVCNLTTIDAEPAITTLLLENGVSSALGPFDFVGFDQADPGGENSDEAWDRGEVVVVRINSESGLKSFTTSRAQSSVFLSKKEGNIGDVERRLERRVRHGLRALAEALVVNDEKDNLVRHARGLLDHITTGGPPPQPSSMFCTPLEHVSSVVDGSTDGDGRNLRNVSVEDALESTVSDPGARPPGVVCTDQSIVRVRRVVHFVDVGALNLFVAVDCVVLPPFQDDAMDEGDKPAEETVWIEVQIGGAQSVTWDVTEALVAPSESRLALIAKANVNQVVSSCGTGLSELHAEVKAITSSERLQVLGSFVITPRILLSGAKSRGTLHPPPWCDAALHEFSEKAEIVLRGPPGSAISVESQETSYEGLEPAVHVRKSENFARVALEAPDGRSMAWCAAELVSGTEENVDVGLALLSKEHAQIMNQASTLLREELVSTRGTSVQSRGKLQTLAGLFKAQAQADEAYGTMEEAFVCSEVSL